MDFAIVYASQILRLVTVRNTGRSNDKIEARGNWKWFKLPLRWPINSSRLHESNLKGH